LAAVRAERTRFPTAHEAAVAAGYQNVDIAGSTIYVHRDHAAVQDALWRGDHGLSGPRWGRTARGDPRAAVAGCTRCMAPEIYTAAMSVDPPPHDPELNPDAMRTGAFQRRY